MGIIFCVLFGTLVFSYAILDVKSESGFAYGEEPMCALQPLTGSCRGHIKRYYYNINAQMCQPFTWGGCDQNANHYSSRERCQSACGGSAGVASFRSRGGRRGGRRGSRKRGRGVKNYASHWQGYRDAYIG